MADLHGKPGDPLQSPTHTVEVTAGPEPLERGNSGAGDEAAAAAATNEAVGQGLQEIEARKVHWYSYLGTADFWLVILLGQFLALCITATNTFSSLLVEWDTSIPAFQTFFNYVLLTAIYLPVTLRRLGPRAFGRVLLRDGWRYLLLSFLDVEGNYFTVLAYRYTNILSAQLINFWAIVVVVAASFALLRVRYTPFQVLGVLVACGGMGLLLASDQLSGANGGGATTLRGDLFALLGATLYGATNTAEEWFVSRRPAYEVLALLGIGGVCINGAQAAIFDRASFRAATWNGTTIGYVAGYTLALTTFYSAVPLLLRVASAAFLNISLLTGNFWGTVIGVRVLGQTVHRLYPVAFVLILLGLVVYFLAPGGGRLGEARKPWLGDRQEDGVAGLGTAKLRALNEARRRGLAREDAAV
ncbi:solute carrier family 35 member F1 [Xylariaceae sp. FL0804]|nr:solute carrier family 35 member F1 [Xylariaceae sp. FL0804]